MYLAESERPVPVARTHRPPLRRAGGHGGDVDVTPRPQLCDVASIMGMPAADVTPVLQSAITRLISEIDSLRTRVGMQQARIAQLERLADQDWLTPIVNRRAFMRELSRIVSFNRRYGATSGVIYFDLNGLKAINDTYGHAAGDAAILKVADALRHNVRESDLVGRLGGDEFAVLMSRAGGEEAEKKAASLKARIERDPLEWLGETIPLRLAYGVHIIGNGENASEALAAADKAMYAQKRGARSSPVRR